VKELSNNKIKPLIPIFIIIGIIILDYLSKLIISLNIIPGEYEMIIGDFLRLTFNYNDNFLFGLDFGIDNPVVEQSIYMAIYILLIGVAIFFYRLIRSDKLFPRILLGFVIAGMVGNFIDVIFGDLVYFGQLRLFFGKIISWIKVMNLPALNISDICMTIGIVVLIIYILIKKQNEVFKTNSV
jgi:signal peptidase II